MTWRDLIEAEPARVVAPWLGGRTIGLGPRRWVIEGDLPPEHGWWAFEGRGRIVQWSARSREPVVPGPDALRGTGRGLAIGDRFVPDGRVPYSEGTLVANCETIYLLPDGLERFASVVAGRAYEGGPLLFVEEAPPDEAADAVTRAWEDGQRTLAGIRGVTPSLDLAFRLLWAQRDEADRRREAAEREARRRELERSTGSAAGRRTLAALDFGLAAKAALALSGAEYLDHRRSGGRPEEMVVRFRLDARRFECVVHAATMRIIEGGLCLTAHGDDGDEENGDDRLSLESLPSVYREAIRTGVLHVRRHA